MSYSTIASYSSSPARSATVPDSDRQVPRPSWLVLIVMTAAVAGVTWGIMRQRMPEVDPRDIVAINLTSARLAIQDARYLDPPEHSAAHYLGAVLALDPDNEDALRALQEIADRFVDQAKSAILEARFAEAALAIERVRRLHPTDRRLTFLEGEFRNALDLHVAARPVNAAPLPAPTTDSPSSSDSKIAKTHDRKEEPSAVEAQTASRDPIAVDQAVAGEGPAKGIARAQNSDELAMEQPTARQDDAAPALAMYQSVENAFEQVRYQLTASQAEPALTRVVSREEQPSAGSATANSLTAPAQTRELKGLRFVEPVYPEAAQVRGMEGWVDLTLTIAASGDVIEARVDDRSGSRSFERAALNAVRQWKYEPNAAGSAAPPQTVPVRVAFRLE